MKRSMKGKMQIGLLADHPAAAKKVARWYYDEWCRSRPEITEEQMLATVTAATNRNSAPMLVLAIEAGEVIGAAQLKIREMNIFPDYEFWLGGVYVDGKARGKGIGSKLVGEVLSRAKSAGIKQLYLQTEDLSGGLYLRHGFRGIEQLAYNGHHVLVMRANIDESTIG